MLWGLRPVEQQAAYGIAVDTLKRQIHMGLLLPRERLPAERKLAEEIGISRVTLREAFRVMETGRYISTKRGAHGGTFVADSETLDDISTRRITVSPATIMRALEFREANEIAAAKLASERRTFPEIKRMNSSLREMQTTSAAGDFRRALTLFKLALGAASHNTYIEEAVEYGIAEMFLPLELMETSANKSKTIKICSVLLEALESKNSAVAEEYSALLVKQDWKIIRLMQRKN